MDDFLSRRRQYILDGRPLKVKDKKFIKTVSDKRKAKLAELNKSGDSKQDDWFEARRLEMTGKCALCGGKSEKHNDDTYRNSIHHLLEKRPTMFPSVATHSDNWLELCFYGNSCHTNIHNLTITWELLIDSAEWVMILEKIKKVFPYIAQGEQKNIPDILLNQLLKQ